MAQQEGDFDDEDPWDDEEPEKELELHREWSSRHSHFHTLGYRDGIEEGKKSSVQQGFDSGYMQGLAAGRDCGLARGWASAFSALPQSIQSLLLDDTARTQVDAVQAELLSLSFEKAANLYCGKINKLDRNVTESVVDDPINAGSIALNDTYVRLEDLHVKVQSLLRSSGILH